MADSKPLRVFNKDSGEYKIYRNMYINQTLEFVLQKKQKYSHLYKTRMTMKDALLLLNNFVDPSDPDIDVSNLTHAYQTAERIRKNHPENKEYQLLGLIHDVGKILYTYNEPSWAVVGDTYVLGCRFPESIVFYDFLKDSPDYNRYDKLGIYEPCCGLDKLNISFGHDEYLYMVLDGNRHLFPREYMDIIRYHSLYPWHTEGEYREFMTEKDHKTLAEVNKFNQFDLYSKNDKIVINQEVIDYYNNLLDIYFPEELNW
jgi:inositol oxygenase